MEVTKENLDAFNHHLDKTLSVVDEERRQGIVISLNLAEEFLDGVSTRPGFSLLVIEYMANEKFPMPSRHAAVVFFKNFIKKKWRVVSCLLTLRWTKILSLTTTAWQSSKISSI